MKRIARPDRRLREFFKNELEVRAAFLFGSVAKKNARSDSDVDLALWLDPAVPDSAYLERRLAWMDDLSNLLRREADVVILNEAGPVLIHQVLRDGRLIYETDPKNTIAFKARAMIDYVDWLPYKTLLDQSTLRHFRQNARHG